MRNPYRQLSVYRISDGFFAPSPENNFYRGLGRFFPGDLDAYEKSWQARGRLSRGLKMLERPLTALFWLSAVICLAGAGLYWKDHHEDVIIQLTILGLIATGANAFLMSNISGPYGRFHTRIGLLLIFPALILVSRWTENLPQRGIAFMKRWQTLSKQDQG
jgi:hypothetical protein